MKTSNFEKCRLLCAIFVSGFLAFGAHAHNNAISGAITSPTPGSTITIQNPANPIQLTGTFGSSGQGAGCGHTTAITGAASTGDVTVTSQTCDNSVWTWTANWTGYSAGSQSVTMQFTQSHGNQFLHTGSATATYTLVFPTTCTPGWIAPLNEGKHTVRGENTSLPIKFCSTGSSASYRVTICPDGQTTGCQSAEASKNEDGIYIFIFNTEGMANGVYDVSTDAPGVDDPTTFKINR